MSIYSIILALLFETYFYKFLIVYSFFVMSAIEIHYVIIINIARTAFIKVITINIDPNCDIVVLLNC